MIKLLVTDGMDKKAVSVLNEKGYEVVEHYYEPEELVEVVKNVDAVIVRSATKVTKQIIDAALKTKMLKLVVRAGVGVDNIDVKYSEENGIVVRNTPCASTVAVAELAIGHMFSLARKLYSSNVSMRSGLWEKKKLKGIELSGKILGLIGFGRIARETARIAEVIGMNVIYNTRSGKKEEYSQYEFVPFDELLARSDFISLHVPYDKEKGSLLDEKEFEAMKEGVYIVNCARGGVVNEEALLKALNSGKVAGAAIDVFEQEPTENKSLCTHDKVSLSPHIGGSTVEAQEKIGEEIVNIIEEFFGEECSYGCI